MSQIFCAPKMVALEEVNIKQSLDIKLEWYTAVISLLYGFQVSKFNEGGGGCCSNYVGINIKFDASCKFNLKVVTIKLF